MLKGRHKKKVFRMVESISEHLHGFMPASVFERYARKNRECEELIDKFVPGATVYNHSVESGDAKH